MLAETEYGFLFFEKTNPEEPYAATKFLTIDALKNYLYEKNKIGMFKGWFRGWQVYNFEKR